MAKYLVCVPVYSSHRRGLIVLQVGTLCWQRERFLKPCINVVSFVKCYERCRLPTTIT